MKLILATLALAATAGLATEASAGATKSTGGSTKSSPSGPTLSYNAQEAFNKSPDKGNLNYQDGKSGFDADIQCVVVSGSTVYFAAEIIRSTIYSVGTWIYVEATDSGEPSTYDTITWLATDYATAYNNCLNQTDLNDGTIVQGNITTK